MDWDQAALKVCNFKQVAAATLDQLRQQAESFGETISKSIVKGIDEATNSLAKFIVTGSPANFKQIGQNLMESITGGVLKSGVSKLAGGILDKFGLGGLLPGSTSKPDGSQGNPLYVNVVNGGGNPFAGGAPPLASFGNAVGGLFGGSTSENANTSGGGSGGFLSDILSAGAGLLGLEGGGDVVPGAAYIVGEKRPELFVPDRPGKIVPDLSKLTPASNGLQASVTMHVHGVQDTDSFRKAAPQIAAEMYRQMAAAHARNGGM